LIKDNGTAMLADMGLCQRIRVEGKPDNRQLAWCAEKCAGTLLYASPQQIGVRYLKRDVKGNSIMKYDSDGKPVMRKPHGRSELVHAEEEITTEAELKAQLARFGEAEPGERWVFEENRKGVKYTSTADIWQTGATIVEATRGEPMFEWHGEDPEKTRMDIKLNRLNGEGKTTEMIENGKIIEENPRETSQSRAALYNMTIYKSARCTANQICALLGHAGLRRDCDLRDEDLEVLPKESDKGQPGYVESHPPRAQAAEIDGAMRSDVIFALREKAAVEGEGHVDQSDAAVGELTNLYAKQMSVSEPALGYARLPDGTRDARHPIALAENGGQVVGAIAKQRGGPRR